MPPTVRDMLKGIYELMLDIMSELKKIVSNTEEGMKEQLASMTDVLQRITSLEQKVAEISTENERLKENMASMEDKLKETSDLAVQVPGFLDKVATMSTENAKLSSDLASMKDDLEEASGLGVELQKLQENIGTMDDLEGLQQRAVISCKQVKDISASYDRFVVTMKETRASKV